MSRCRQAVDVCFWRVVTIGMTARGDFRSSRNIDHPEYTIVASACSRTQINLTPCGDPRSPAQTGGAFCCPGFIQNQQHAKLPCICRSSLSRPFNR